jgi:hypothetical protein
MLIAIAEIKTKKKETTKMDKFYEDRERDFFVWFDKAQAIADKHEVSIYTVYNARQIWDFAYTAGALQNAKEEKVDSNE